VFQIPNGSCESILDIYFSIVFQWYKELFNPLGFDFCNRSLKIRESIGIPNSQSGSSLGSVKVHSLTLSYTPRSMVWFLASLFALALVINPKLGLRHYSTYSKHTSYLPDLHTYIDAPPSSLMDSIVSPKVKIVEGKKIRAHSLTHNTLGVKGHVGAPRWD
jgi:hypothetical protein